MTAYFPFTPSRKTAPNFMPTLDGKQYNCTVTWNLGGQRYYLNVFTLSGDRVLSIAIVETPADIAIQSGSYDDVRGVATIILVASHGLKLGSTAQRRVTGCDPNDFDGTYPMLVSGPFSLTYTPATVPASGAVTVGTVGAPANLVAGYFASTLLYRNARFEVD